MVFVTGGTGFLGSYILRELVSKGYQVRALRRGNKEPNWIPRDILDKVEWVEGDVLDVVSLADGMEGADYVIHSAAVVSFFKKERSMMYQVNVDGTANVVNTALELGIKKFVHISSVAALGRKENGNHVNEDTKWEESRLNTHYAKSKFKAELEAWRGSGEGLPTVILNPSTILGYGDWHSSSCAIFRSAFDEFPWYTPGINGFVDVEDVARAAVALMESPISEKRFVVCGDNWPFRQLFDTMADGFGKKRPHRATSPLLVSIAWRMEKIKSLFTGKKPLLTRESARVAQSRTFFEHDRILAALPGFQFTPLVVTIRNACVKYQADLSK